MKIKRPNFWHKRNIYSYFFFPFTIITFIINFLKSFLIKNKLSIKTICVGNIFIGGTGKTSLVIEINKILNKKSKTVFIKKKYKNQKDEIQLLQKNGNLVVHKNRIKAIKIAEDKGFKIALLDDGLQQKNINYDLKIVCFNSYEGFGNGYLLPAGPLRENINEIKKYDIAVINGEKKNKKLYLKIKSINENIKIFKGKYIPKNLSKLDRKKKYFMFCGIGNPKEFENTLKKYKFKIKNKKIFPDHFQISSAEIEKLKKFALKKNLDLITTEKDYLRIKKNDRNDIKYLKIDLKINDIEKFKNILSLNL